MLALTSLHAKPVNKLVLVLLLLFILLLFLILFLKFKIILCNLLFTIERLFFPHYMQLFLYIDQQVNSQVAVCHA